MFRNVFVALFIATMAVTGCSGSTQEKTGPTDDSTASESNPISPETTVTINGKEWTCEQITATEPQECGDLTQKAFDSYKGNIDTYVNSGKLGPLNDGKAFSYEDAAFAGLVACAYIKNEGSLNGYIEFMMETEPFNAKLTERSAYLPAWFEASKSLCPHNQNPGSIKAP